MKKASIILIILFTLALVTNCKSLGKAVFPVATGEFINPIIHATQNNKEVDCIIKDAKITLTEITQLEYDKAKKVNVIAEQLNVFGPITRYIRVDLKILIDEKIGFQNVDFTISDLNPNGYFGEVCFEYEGKMEKFNMSFYFAEPQQDLQFYSFIIKMDYLITDSYENNIYYSIGFQSPTLIDEGIRLEFINDKYEKSLEIKEITKEEYESANGINVFKEESYGIYKELERYIYINIQSLRQSVQYTITNLKHKENAYKSYEGDIAITKDEEIVYAKITIRFASEPGYGNIDMVIEYDEGEFEYIYFRGLYEKDILENDFVLNNY